MGYETDKYHGNHSSPEALKELCHDSLLLFLSQTKLLSN